MLAGAYRQAAHPAGGAALLAMHDPDIPVDVGF
jgi:hypothetical protein